LRKQNHFSAMADRDPAIHRDADVLRERPGAPPAAVPRPPRTLGTPAATAIAVVASLVGLVVLAWAVLYVTKGRFLKPTFERIASSSSERPVRVAGDFQFYFDPIALKFRAEGLTVGNPAWVTAAGGPRDVFAARLIDARVPTLTWIFGSRRRVDTLLLDGGRVDLEWDAQRKRNTWTFGDPNAKGEPFQMPVIRLAQVSDTRVRYRDPQLQLAADMAVGTIRASGQGLQTRIADAIRFTGSGSARRTPFRLSGALLSPDSTIAGGETRLQLHAEAVRTLVDVTGTLPGATELEGARLAMDVRGRNLADIFTVAGIAVPDTRPYRMRANVTKAGDEWRFTRLVGRYGDSDLSGRLTVAMTEPRMKLTADLATRTLALADFAPFIGYNPDAAAKGPAAVTRTVGGTPRILPDAPLRVDALRNFDAAVHYTVRTVRARSFPVSDIDLTLGLDDRLLTLSPLTFTMARGHVASDITINARRQPVFTDYDIRLAPTPMGKLLAGWGVEEAGTSGTIKARIKMSGTGNSVADSLATANGRIAIIMPKGTFWARNVQLSEIDVGTFIQKMFEKKLKEPVQINCGLIGFTVRNGVAAADPILIDTQKNVMLGRGGFSFRTEGLDLAFRADSKKFSLFAGQSPVGINGQFAKPGFDVVSPELVGRAGAGLGLGIVASPVAAVLAFVDVGDAKGAQCGPVLAGASAAAQRTRSGERRDDVGNGSTGKSEDGKRSGDERREQKKKFLGIF
jgi:AsmA family protein